MDVKEFESDMRMLVAELIQDIGDDYRAGECECRMENDLHDEDCLPSMQLTIGADSDGWAYQTGDNSYSGGAYGYATWAVVSLYRDSVPADIAEDIVVQLNDADPCEYDAELPPIFEKVSA